MKDGKKKNWSVRDLAVLCDGQESTQDYLRRRLSTIMESVGWVCEEAMEGHEWVSELTISMQETENLVGLKYEIDVPCVVQWRLLWFSSPSRLNQRFADNATIFEKYYEVMKFANVATFTAFLGDSRRPEHQFESLLQQLRICHTFLPILFLKFESTI